MEFYENKQEPEKAVLIAVDTGEYDCDISLDELEELAETAGAEVVGRMSQKRDKPDSGTFLGSGKKLTANVPERLNAGDTFCLCDSNNRFVVTKE